MIQADTIHFSVPRDALTSFKPDHFVTNTKTDAAGELRSVHSRLDERARQLGLSKLLIHEERVEIELSAKILGDWYIHGISERTVERVPDSIASRGVVTFDAEKFLNGAELYRLDVTANIKPSDIRGAIYAASIGSMNQKWNHTNYGRVRDDGFVFKSRLKTNTRRLIGYDKHREMTSRGNVKHADELRADLFRGVLRMETNLRTYRDVRQMLGIDTLRLTDALSSQRNPNLQMFDEIIGGAGSDERLAVVNRMMNDVRDHGMQRFMDVLAMERTFEMLGGEWPLIEAFVRNGYRKPSGAKRQLRKWKGHFSTWMLAKSSGEAGDVRAVLEEMRDLLKAA